MSPLKINYPDGKPFHYNSTDYKSSQRNTTLSYGNRGMNLEKDLNITNKQYRTSNLAIIHKKPTPVQVVTVDYPRREAAKITEAYYRRSSTTDYNGIYKGFYIDFEAKETKSKTSLPLNNFHEHQITHMKQCTDHGGICFAIVQFSTLDDIYLLPDHFIYKWWEQQFNAKGRKSIPLSAIEKECYKIPYEFNPRIPYLKVVDELIKQKNSK